MSCSQQNLSDLKLLKSNLMQNLNSQNQFEDSPSKSLKENHIFVNFIYKIIDSALICLCRPSNQ